MGISPVQLGIILLIVLLLFGTKRLRGLGADLGGGIKGFRHAMTEDKGIDEAQRPYGGLQESEPASADVSGADAQEDQSTQVVRRSG